MPASVHRCLSVLLFLLILNVAADANQWTWVLGDNTINTDPSYGAINVPDSGNRPGARYGAGDFVYNGSPYLYAGRTADSVHRNDM